jgi:ribonuclease HI/probable phosphoglycerate mutase
VSPAPEAAPNGATSPSTATEYVLYCDGASRGNPGAAAIGFALFDPAGTEILGCGEAIGRETNNVAEYTALLRGLEAARAQGVRRLRVRMDSELVVRQLLGVYRVKHPGLQPLYAAVQQARRGFESFRIEHVPRRDNARADALANAALDALKSPEK